MEIKLSNIVYNVLIIGYVLSVEELSIMVPYYSVIHHTPNMMAYVRIDSVTYLPDSKWDHVRSISMVKMLAIISGPPLILSNSAVAPYVLKHFTDFH